MRVIDRALTVLVVPALCLAAGCGGKPVSAPGYSAPSESEALDAYRNSVLGKHIEGASSDEVMQRVVEKDGNLNAVNHHAITLAQSRESHNERVEELAKNLQSTDLSDCVWERFSPGAVKAKYKEEESGPAPEAAYRCKVAVTIDTDTRGLVQGPTEGFFFKKDDGSFVFVGKLAKDYKRLDGKEDEPEEKKPHGGSEKWV